ncbi:unnamed protein product [Lepeophtheirus salmonis]|uniref:(salmon louse) hypothetical protein n=1 Tax=Lepeophtheirus salmonis TaxID=72036 RepID=A0A7R8CGK1_LEPSM|nr:unnamed protein product [Lepeophtheirus salmonis]CAF2816549.1 unnamed protein product [Lepeophtheirus salmonis]
MCNSRIYSINFFFCIVLTITQRPIPAEFTDNVCSIQNKCCNMAKNNCCTQGNCYTVWERICDSAIEDHQCQTQPLSICPSSYNGKIPTTRYMNNNCININPPICEESICKPYSPNNNQKDFNNQQCCRQKKKKYAVKCRQELLN